MRVDRYFSRSGAVIRAPGVGVDAKKPNPVMEISRVIKLGLGRAATALGIMATLLAGCSPTALLDRLTPAGDYRRDPGLSYGADPRQTIDVYEPATLPGSEMAGAAMANATMANATMGRPVVVFFYGGSWRWGEKESYRFVADALTRQGVVVMIPDYRVYPQVQYPVFIEDSAAAMRWARDHAAEYGGDPQRLFIMGHSAGAYNAAMVALDERWLAKVGMTRRDIAGFIGISGPYDFLPTPLKNIQPVFATATDQKDAEPLAHADAGAPPTLLIHGTADTYVYLRNSEHLAARLRDSGAQVKFVSYFARGHLDIMLGLSTVFDSDGKLLAEVVAFMAGQG